MTRDSDRKQTSKNCVNNDNDVYNNNLILTHYYYVVLIFDINISLRIHNKD